MNCGRLSGQQTCWQLVEVSLNSGLVQKKISAMNFTADYICKGDQLL